MRRTPTSDKRMFYTVKKFSKSVWVFMPRKSFGFFIEKDFELVERHSKEDFFFDFPSRNRIKVSKEKAKEILGPKYFKLVPRNEIRFEEYETDESW
jgi:hypothetical protein